MRQENICIIEIKSCIISSCGDKSSLFTISISLSFDFKNLSNQSKPNFYLNTYQYIFINYFLSHFKIYILNFIFYSYIFEDYYITFLECLQVKNRRVKIVLYKNKMCAIISNVKKIK